MRSPHAVIHTVSTAPIKFRQRDKFEDVVFLEAEVETSICCHKETDAYSLIKSFQAIEQYFQESGSYDGSSLREMFSNTTPPSIYAIPNNGAYTYNFTRSWASPFEIDIRGKIILNNRFVFGKKMLAIAIDRLRGTLSID